MTRGEAVALRLRLEAGLSWFNERGEERMVEPKKAKPAKDPGGLPTVERLMARFEGHSPSTGTGGPDVPAMPDREAQRRREDARRAEEAEKTKAEIAMATASMMARLESRIHARRSLPCYTLDPMAHPDRGGTDALALAACEAVKGYRECEWARDPQACPRNRVDAGYEAIAGRLRQAEVPLLLVELLLEASSGHRVNGRRVAAVPLAARPALRVVDAWIAGGGAEVAPFAPFTGRRPLLVLAGATGGEGKSVAAASMLAARDGLWISCSKLVQISAAKYDQDRFASPGALVIDDAGTEPLTEWGRGRVYDLIADRMGNGRRTIVTTNLTERELFVARYDERLGRRIAESGRFVRLGAWRP